jgi:hypothetical protein
MPRKDAPSTRRSSATRSQRVETPLRDPRFDTPNPDEERQYLEDMRMLGYGVWKRWWQT